MARGILGRRPTVFAAHGAADGTTPVEMGRSSASLGRKAGLAVQYA